MTGLIVSLSITAIMLLAILLAHRDPPEPSIYDMLIELRRVNRELRESIERTTNRLRDSK